LHAKLKETSGDNVLNLFTHVLEVKSIRANEDSSDHLLGEPTCAIDTDGGNYDLHFAAIDRERPEQQLGILVESATGRKFQVAINTSLRVQLSCQLVAPINGDPMLVADDEKVVVRWHGQFYEALIDDLQSDNQLPGEEAPKGSGCAVGPFAVHVMAKTNANADEAIVAAITIPNSKNAQKRILLKRV
jgi:hypothetical protein